MNGKAAAAGPHPVKLLPREETEKMFGRFGALRLDTSGLRRKFPDCPYGRERHQAMDIYLPNGGDGPFPVVFFLHGGGWSGGSRRDAQVLPFMGGCARGYAVISLGYRLVPDILYPENLYDVKSALRWVAENAETYLLDPSRVALTGASAGAHLAMMAAFTQGQAAFEGAPLSATCTVRAVVNQYGPTDFLKIHPQFDASGCPRTVSPDDPGGDMTARLLGVSLARIPNLAPFVNPIDNIHPHMPPVLSQHGLYDPVIPFRQAETLHEAIEAVCGPGRSMLDASRTRTHADPGYAEPDSVERIFSFLDTHLKAR